jgi:hypothetical protein
VTAEDAKEAEEIKVMGMGLLCVLGVLCGESVVPFAILCVSAPLRFNQASSVPQRLAGLERVLDTKNTLLAPT